MSLWGKRSTSSTTDSRYSRHSSLYRLFTLLASSLTHLSLFSLCPPLLSPIHCHSRAFLFFCVSTSSGATRKTLSELLAEENSKHSNTQLSHSHSQSRSHTRASTTATGNHAHTSSHSHDNSVSSITDDKASRRHSVAAFGTSHTTSSTSSSEIALDGTTSFSLPRTRSHPHTHATLRRITRTASRTRALSVITGIPIFPHPLSHVLTLCNHIHRPQLPFFTCTHTLPLSLSRSLAASHLDVALSQSQLQLHQQQLQQLKEQEDQVKVFALSDIVSDSEEAESDSEDSSSSSDNNSNNLISCFHALPRSSSSSSSIPIPGVTTTATAQQQQHSQPQTLAGAVVIDDYVQKFSVELTRALTEVAQQQGGDVQDGEGGASALVQLTVEIEDYEELQSAK